MLLEISYPLSQEIPVYPGSPEERFLPKNRMTDGDDCNTTSITHYLHNGTHVDAPFHFDKDGKDISLIPIEDFLFTFPLVVACPLGRSGLITVDHIKVTAGYREADLLLFNTGYSAYRDDAAVYSDDFPSLSYEAATFIRNELPNLKGIAIDSLSIESAVFGSAEGFRVHKMLLDHTLSSKRTLLIFEDVNVELVAAKRLERVYAFPLRLVGLDASPVTIVAEVCND